MKESAIELQVACQAVYGRGDGALDRVDLFDGAPLVWAYTKPAGAVLPVADWSEAVPAGDGAADEPRAAGSAAE